MTTRQDRESYQVVSPALSPDKATGRQLRLVSVGDDYLLCNPVGTDGEPIDVNIYVMKPWTMRRSPFDGQTDAAGISYTYASNTQRTATRADVTEVQLITPDYSGGDVIYAELCAELFLLSNGHQTRLMDSNRDGRAWAHLDS